MTSRADTPRARAITPKQAAAFANFVRRTRENRVASRERLDRIKLDAGCADCGYRAHAVALDFDHRGAKSAGVSRLMRDGAAWERIAAEIAECDVVCANCHRVRSLNAGHFASAHLGDDEVPA